MHNVLSEIGPEIHQLTTTLIQQQKHDGSWHFCFENGTSVDAFVIILLRTLNVANEALIHQLHDRILAEQQPEGHWKLFYDEQEGHLSTSIDAYYALLYSGYSHTSDAHMLRAKSYIQSKGGLGKATSILTRVILAATGQAKWPASISSIPLEILLLPTSFPINLFDFSGYSRVHLVPLLIMADRKFSIQTEHTPVLTDLQLDRTDTGEPPSREFQDMLIYMQNGLNQLMGTPRYLHDAAITKAEQFMQARIESDGTLYSYASSTILMIFALLALGYDRQDPLITHAVQGLIAMQWRTDRTTTIQNSPSTVWDTALIAYAMQESGIAENHKTIQRAAAYLSERQQHKSGDWSIHNPHTLPGGWGFSETNTINPDVDDTTAALRAMKNFSTTNASYLDSWNRGLLWVISMQNKDGGWPAFEKNTNKEILTWLAIDGAKSAAIDPSEADLTGRALEYLGNFAGLHVRHDFIQRGTEWLMNHQEQDGSWYGRWGVCYIYGTWAALTGLTATGVSPHHTSIQKGAQWLASIQNADGGWGESCRSDRLRRYIPLGASTPSQTAWALDALIAVHSQPTDEIDQGIRRLIALLHEDNWMTSYPTGAGLPGMFYIHYHSYRYIWPLVALSHYRKKYGDHAL
ncbi:squalene--hopene cyclase [Paenibacillus selenitireducens]|uniref:Squalene--hopene cyclase n=1 Tax=Paenibacillus selenitireducens TaxID=1324314 RepID=A0A1T2XMB8_9BACL|nr:squalene--hopene cyclase [Paenibacillus selenitireducens]OPA81014.1 squalene--hopene cyclase [Paenibacillus selenitireducens]